MGLNEEQRVPSPTARLSFRTWREADFPLAVALWGDPRVTAFIGGPFSEEEIRQRLEREMALQHDHGLQYWPIFLLEGLAHVGCCGLRPYRPEQGVLEIGFHLRAEHWGKGLAVEAAHAVMAHAFGALGAKALFAGHHPDNHASRRAVGRLGLRYTHDELYPPTGQQHPSYLLTREEYLASRPSNV